MALTIVSITSATTIPLGQGGVVYAVDASGGGFTITLPDATKDDSDTFVIKRVDTAISNVVSIAPQSGQKIDNSSASLNLNSNKCYEFMCYNNLWFTLTNTT